MKPAVRLRRSARLRNKREAALADANAETITSVEDDRRGRAVSRYPSTRRRNRKQNSEFDVSDKDSDCSHHDGTDNEMASLAYTESDDGTVYLSDDCSTSRGVTTDKETPDQNEHKSSTSNFDEHVQHCEVGKYMASREMTPLQERMNALTVLPSTYYCIMFVLSGSWLSESFVEAYAQRMVDDDGFDTSQCIDSSWFPHLHALPPLALLATAIGILSHAPFSMIYHWRYAHRLPAGFPRTNHWSRRMDQAMIHVMCAFISYGLSGDWRYFLANALFNMDCFYRQFLQKVRPRRNQVRIGMSIFFYALPLLMRGEFGAFSKLAVLCAFSGWLFGQYPIGGWSHAVFHICLAFIPPLLFPFALKLSSSQSQLELAAHCAILADKGVLSY